jgi:hypothetical protein
MIARRLTGGDLVRPQPGHWDDLRTYLHPEWPTTPPICFVVARWIAEQKGLL